MPTLIGCDPEFFIRNKDNGAYISAHDRVPGTKQDPHKLPNGGYVQADGTAVEFNIPPARTAKMFKDHILSALNDIRNEFFKDKQDLMFAFDPVATYEPSYFKGLPLSAKELGCDPDFNAYNAGKPNPKPDGTRTYRTGSGHIHVGFLEKDEFVPSNEEPCNDPIHMKDCMALAVALDYTLTMFRHKWDQDTTRAKMYGNIGCFRPKHYGMEYRTLSNAWLRHPDLWPWLFNNSVRAVELASDKGFNNLVVRYGMYNVKTYMNAILRAPENKNQYYSYLNSCGGGELIVNGVIQGPSKHALTKKLSL